MQCVLEQVAPRGGDGENLDSRQLAAARDCCRGANVEEGAVQERVPCVEIEVGAEAVSVGIGPEAGCRRAVGFEKKQES